MPDRLGEPGRQPPRALLRELRKEVHFRCPIPDCGSPYLTWHHFDPPWRVERHHRISGMIALCREHADKADNGAFTNDQLRNFKSQEYRHESIFGTFDWKRQHVLVVTGSIFHYDCDVAIQFGDDPALWFNRDADGSLLLNFWLPSFTGEPRVEMEDNVWIVPPAVDELISPPHGRLIEVRYASGDYLKIEYREARSQAELLERYPSAGFLVHNVDVSFPLTIVEIAERLQTGSDIIELARNATTIFGMTMVDCWSVSAGGVGFRLPAIPPGVGMAQSTDAVINVDSLPAGVSRVKRHRFDRCTFVGPMIILLQDTHVGFSDSADAEIWRRALSDRPSKVGTPVLLLERCFLTDCDFSDCDVLGQE